MKGFRAFTLVELLVVVAIIALLLGILLPSLSKARELAMTTKCLANMRNLQIAHQMYITEWNGRFINVGLGHGLVHANEQAAWINTLEDSFGSELLARSPVDDSPHWGPAPEGEPIPGADPNQRRRSSYGVNNFLTDLNGNGQNPYGPRDPDFGEGGWPGGDGMAYDHINRVPNPGATVHFVIMAFEGAFAGADHIHAENWLDSALPPSVADDHVQIDAHGEGASRWEAVSNWGFLDGHAETLRFDEIVDRNDPIGRNLMNPMTAR